MSSSPDTAADPLTCLVQQAMQHHAAGRPADARALYNQVLAQDPAHPDALHLLGLIEAQAGNHQQAQALIWQAIQARPGEAMFHNNLANVCVELGQLDHAEAMYVRALELDGSRTDALSNLGVLLGKTKRLDDAERLLLKAIELAPSNPDWRQNLANLYLAQGRDAEALTQCHDGLVIAPRSRVLRALLVMAYTALGLNDKAVAVLQAWIQNAPDDPYPHHHLAACTGQQVPDRAADAYVASVFDGFARSFDAKLADLSYQAPQLVADEVMRRVGAPAQMLAVLDAGCGTGLCGPLLAPFADTLTGVDLSEGMLRKAAERQCYTHLFQGELVAFLSAQPDAYGLIASADTLCYFGKLDGFAQAAKTALRSGGVLVFTVEAHGDESSRADAHNNGDEGAVPDYILRGHGRYSQSRRYVVSSLQIAGLVDVQAQPVVLRNEGGKPVSGWLVSARAASAA